MSVPRTAFSAALMSAASPTSTSIPSFWSSGTRMLGRASARGRSPRDNRRCTSALRRKVLPDDQREIIYIHARCAFRPVQRQVVHEGLGAERNGSSAKTPFSLHHESDLLGRRLRQHAGSLCENTETHRLAREFQQR